MEEIGTLIRDPGSDLSELREQLKNLHFSILQDPANPAFAKIPNLLKQIAGRPDKIDDERWDSIVLMVLAIVLSVHPPPKLLPSVSLDTTSSWIFELRLMIRELKCDQTMEEYVKALSDGLTSVSTESHAFGARTAANSLISIPRNIMAVRGWKTSHFAIELLRLLDGSIGKPFGESELILYMNIAKLLQERAPEMRIGQMFKWMLKDGMVAPMTIVSKCLYPMLLTENFRKFLREDSIMELVTLTVEKAAVTWPHGVSRASLLINICDLTREEQRWRVLTFLAEGIRSQARMRREEIEFMGSKEEYLRFFVQSLVMWLNEVVYYLRKIKFVQAGDRNDITAKRLIPFAWQYRELKDAEEADYHLLTKVKIYYCGSNEEALNLSAKNSEPLEMAYRKLSPRVKLPGLLIVKYCEFILRTEENSMFIAHLTLLLEEMFDFVVACFYGLMLMQGYLLVDIAPGKQTNGAPAFLHDGQFSRMLPPWQKAVHDFVEFVFKLDRKLYPVLIQTLVHVLWKTVQKGKVTLGFIDFLMRMLSKLDAQLITSLLSYMMKFWNDRFTSLNSSDYTETLVLQQWIFLMTRMTVAKSAAFGSAPARRVASMFKSAQIVGSFLASRPRDVISDTILDMFIWMSKFVRTTLKGIPPDPMKISVEMFRDVFRTVPPFMQKSLALLVLETAKPDVDQRNLLACEQFVGYGLCSSDPEISSKSLLLLTELLKIKPVDFCSLSTQRPYRSFAQGVFHALKHSPETARDDLARLITDNPALFLDNAGEERRPTRKASGALTFYGMDVQELLSELFKNMEGHLLEAPFVLSLLVDLFREKREDLLDSEGRYLGDYLRILHLLSSKFEKLVPQVRQLLDDMIQCFVNTRTDDFFVDLVMQTTKPVGIFWEAANKYVTRCPTSMFIETPEKLVVRGGYAMSNFNSTSTMIGLLLLAKKEPTLVRWRYVRMALGFSRWLDSPKLMKMLLKTVLPTFSEQEVADFMVFGSSFTTFPVLIHPILKFMGTTGKPIDVARSPLRPQGNTRDFYHLLSCYVLCGTTEPFRLNEGLTSLLERQLQELASVAPGQDRASQTARVSNLLSSLNMIWAFLKRGDVSLFTPGILDATSSIIHYVMRFGNQVLQKIVKKCVDLLSKAPESSSSVHPLKARIDTVWARIESDYVTGGKAQAVLNWVTYVNRKISNINPLFSHLKSFCDLQKEDAIMKFLMMMDHIVVIIKLLTSCGKANIDAFRELFIPHGAGQNTNLRHFLNVMARLNAHELVPFEYVFAQPVSQLLELVCHETVKYLLPGGGCNLLEPLSCSKQIRQKVCDELTIVDPASYSPFAARLLSRLVKKYPDTELAELLEQKFISLSHKYVHAQDGWRITETVRTNDVVILSILGASYIKMMSKKETTDFAWVFRSAAVLGFHPFMNSKLLTSFVRAISRMSQEQIQALQDVVIRDYSSLTDHVASLVLKLCMESCHSIDDTRQELIWNFLLGKIESGEHQAANFECCRLLIKKGAADQRHLIPLLKCIPQGIMAPDGAVVESCLSLCVELVNVNLMPPIILNQICIHLLSFEKFLEPPLLRPFAKLLGSVKDDCSDELRNALTVFFVSQLRTKKEDQKSLQNIATFVQHCPTAVNLAAVPVVSSFVRIFETYKERGELLPACAPALQLLSCLCQQGIVMAKSEKERLAALGYECINIIFREQKNDQYRIVWMFCSSLMQIEHDSFPKELLMYENISEEYYPCLAACALSMMPPEVTMDGSLKRFWDMAVHSLFTCKSTRPAFLSTVITHIAQDPHVRSQLMKPFMALLMDGPNSDDPLEKDRRHQILKIVFAVDEISRLETMDIFLQRNMSPGPARYPSQDVTFFRTLVQSMEYLRPEQQTHYFYKLLGNVLDSAPQWIGHLATMSTYLLGCGTMSKEAKSCIVKELLPHLPKCEPRYWESFVKQIKDTDFLSSYYPLACISFALSSKYATRVKYLDLVRNVLGHTERDRLIAMQHLLPETIWTDENLVPLCLVISEQRNLWHPLAGLSHEIVFAGSDILRSILVRVLREDDDELMSAAVALFLHSLHQDARQIQTGFLAAFDEKQIFPDALLTVTAIKNTGNVEYLNPCHYEGLNEKILWNPDVQGPILDQFLDTSNAAATAYFMLRDIQEANMIGFEVSSPLAQKLDEIARQCELRESSVFVDFAQSDAAAELSKIVYMSHPKRHNLERFVTIKLAERIKTGHCLPSKFIFERSLSRYQREYLRRAEQRIDPASPLDISKPGIVTAPEGSPLLVFAPCVEDMFRQVAGYTPKGFIVATPDQVKRALERVGESSNNQYNMYKWSIITYTLYLSSPTDMLARSVVRCYCSLLENMTFPLFMKMSMAARMITIFRIGLSSNDRWPAFSEKTMQLLGAWPAQVRQLGPQVWDPETSRKIVSDATAIVTDRSLGIPPQGAMLKAPIPASVINSLDKFSSAVLHLMDLDFETYKKKHELATFIRDVQTGHPKPRVPSGVSIESMNIEEIKGLNNRQALMRFIDSQFPSSNSYASMRESIARALATMNDNLPLVLRSRMGEFIDHLRDLKPLFILPDIEKVSENALQVQVMTIPGGMSWFLLQRCDSAAVTVTFTSFVCMFKEILKWCYQSRLRSLSVAPFHTFPISQNLVMTKLPGPVTPDHMRLCIAQSKSERYRMQLAAARSLAVEAVLRDMFSLRQRQRELVCPSMSSVFTSITDFRVSDSSNAPSIYITPEMRERFADAMKGEVILSLAAVGESIVQNIESVRAFIEIVVGDNLGPGNVQNNSLLARTAEIETKALRFARPVLPGCVPDDAREWIDSLKSFFESALYEDVPVVVAETYDDLNLGWL